MCSPPCEARPRRVLETFVLLLAPFAPHIAEEMWMKLGYRTTLAFEPWPVADPELLRVVVDLQEYPVQINGKLRARVMAAPQLDRDGLIAAVEADPQVQRLLANVTVVKVVAVPGRLVSFVVKN